MKANLKLSLIIAKKEIKEIIMRSKYMLSTVIAVPVVMGVVLPLILSYVMLSTMTAGASSSIPYMVPLLFPNLGSFSPNAVFFVYFINIYVTILELMMVVALPVYIAADSFAGEKERNTIEPLLATPLSNFEILIGKVLTSFIPAVAMGFFSYVLSIICVNIVSFGYFNFLIYPSLPAVVLYILGVPILGLLTILTMVLLSSKVKKVRESTQLGGFVIIPLIVFLFFTMLGVIPFNIVTIGMFLLVIGVITLAVIFFGVKTFQRQKLIE